MSFFSASLEKTIHDYLQRYETKRSAILPILHAIQDEKGWISDEDILALEAECGLSAVHVREVVTFYTMYRTKPSKPYRFEICKSISCFLMGAQNTIKTVKDTLQKAKDEGRELPFEVHEVECLGQCGYAPASLINKDRQNCVTPEKALKLIQEYCAKETLDSAIKPRNNTHTTRDDRK